MKNDFIRRWGNAQECQSCGYVLPYGPYNKIQRCCGKEMGLANTWTKENLWVARDDKGRIVSMIDNLEGREKKEG